MPYSDKTIKSDYDRKRYLSKKGDVLLRSNSYYSDNKLEILEKRKQYYYKNKDILIPKRKEYSLKNKKIIAERKADYYKKVTKLRLEQEPGLKIKYRLRKRIWDAIKTQKTTKNTITLQLLGCDDINIVLHHLKKQFKEGMTWDNYGMWHIDHIIPLSKFNLVYSEEQILAFHYKNLQPLWAIDNLRKGDRLEPSETTR